MVGFLWTLSSDSFRENQRASPQIGSSLQSQDSAVRYNHRPILSTLKRRRNRATLVKMFYYENLGRVLPTTSQSFMPTYLLAFSPALRKRYSVVLDWCTHQSRALDREKFQERLCCTRPIFLSHRSLRTLEELGWSFECRHWERNDRGSPANIQACGSLALYWVRESCNHRCIPYRCLVGSGTRWRTE